MSGTVPASSDSRSNGSNGSIQLPFAEKYRPRVLDDVKGHADVLQYLKRCLAMRVVPHLLFVGPPGVGKTTCATCFALEYLASNGDTSVSTEAARNPDTPKVKEVSTFAISSRLLVLNASLIRTPRAISHRIGAFLDRLDLNFGGRVVSEATLRSTVDAAQSSSSSSSSSSLSSRLAKKADDTKQVEQKQTQTVASSCSTTTATVNDLQVRIAPKRVVVCDEVDSMTVAAHQALRSMLASYQDRAIFILTCNKLECVSEALQSLCFIVNFRALDIMQAAEVVASVAHSEGIDVTLDGIRALVSVARGDLRAALSALQTSASRGCAASASSSSLPASSSSASSSTTVASTEADARVVVDDPTKLQNQLHDDDDSSTCFRRLPVNKRTVYDTSDIPLPAKMERVLETSCSSQPRDALTAVEKYHCIAGHSIADMLFVLQQLITTTTSASTSATSSPKLAKVLSGSFLTVVLEHLESAKQAPATLLQLQACLARISASYSACFL